jgi:malate synthase
MINTKNTSTDVRDDFKEAFDELTEDYDRLQGEVAEATADLAKRLRPTHGRLVAARQHLDSYNALRSEANDDVAEALEEVEEALGDFRIALKAARADVAAETAPQVASYRKAFNDQVGQWRGRIEYLALQSDLARMDLRDEIVGVHDDYVMTRRNIRGELLHAETVGTTAWEGIRDRARDELDILGVNYNALLDRVRSTQ